MTREEAIQVLSQRPMIAPSKSNKQKMFEEAIDMAIDALSAEPKIKVCEERQNGECPFYTPDWLDDDVSEPSDLISRAKWIPCSERLPKKGEVVLITNGKGNVRCGKYRSEYDVRDGTHYWWWKGKTVESVLAWMTLPKPYKGGDDE